LKNYRKKNRLIARSNIKKNISNAGKNGDGPGYASRRPVNLGGLFLVLLILVIVVGGLFLSSRAGNFGSIFASLRVNKTTQKQPVSQPAVVQVVPPTNLPEPTQVPVVAPTAVPAGRPAIDEITGARILNIDVNVWVAVFYCHDDRTGKDNKYVIAYNRERDIPESLKFCQTCKDGVLTPGSTNRAVYPPLSKARFNELQKQYGGGKYSNESEDEGDL